MTKKQFGCYAYELSSNASAMQNNKSKHAEFGRNVNFIGYLGGEM
jgi:hypothetical protein